MKKIIAAVMALFIMLIPTLGVYAEETEDFNADAYSAFENLIVGWTTQGLEMYPDYVGGVYFDEDGLVVALSEDNQANRNEILSLTEYPNVIDFITVTYSYEQLQDVVEEITYNCDNNNYNFLVNFANIVEEENIVEISVGSSALTTASSYFTSLYGDKVTIYGGYDTVSDTDYEENNSGGRADKIASTKELRRYISIGVIAVLVVVVLITTLKASSNAKSSKRRYRK